jgi:hypothetical protein
MNYLKYPVGKTVQKKGDPYCSWEKLPGSLKKSVEYHPRDGDHDYKDDNPDFGLAMGTYS